MNCLSFPSIFKGNSTKIITEDDATKVCLYLLLNCEKREMFGDPDFGIALKKYKFNQNNFVLKDILIEEIYTQITTFCPQIMINRKDIQIYQSNYKLACQLTYRNQKDFKVNVFNLVLFKGEDD